MCPLYNIILQHSLNSLRQAVLSFLYVVFKKQSPGFLKDFPKLFFVSFLFRFLSRWFRTALSMLSSIVVFIYRGMQTAWRGTHQDHIRRMQESLALSKQNINIYVYEYCLSRHIMWMWLQMILSLVKICAALALFFSLPCTRIHGLYNNPSFQLPNFTMNLTTEMKIVGTLPAFKTSSACFITSYSDHLLWSLLETTKYI